MAGTTTEVPFLSGMERQTCETTVNVGKKLFRLDGMVERILVKAKAALSVRGPDPGYPNIEERLSALERRPPLLPSNDWNEAPKENGLKAVIIGCTIAIMSSGILAAFTLAWQFSEFRGQVSEWQKAIAEWKVEANKRLDRLENRR